MKLLPTAILAWLFFGTFGVFSAVWTALFIVRSEFPTALVALGVAVFCFGLIIPLVKVVRENVEPRAEIDEDGTTFRPDRWIDIPVLMSLSGLVVASAMITVLAPPGKLDIAIPPFMRYSLPLVCAVVVLTGAPTLWRNFRRGSTSYLRLTLDGFELAQGWRSMTGDWADVQDVTDEVPGQQAHTPNAIVFVMSDDTAPTLAAASYTPDAAAIRDLVRFYWKHADSRAELTDGRALHRLNR
ncbi:hypothetical protein [Mycobacterium sp. IS-3022]|uniref:hypothetical protein n=1 Tax=Mycobacterium sp. IS-3022 TaxID=1772277 RepID=UPI000A45831B|nr:hypothetical protein [Mycobacterium sp. IS-3022]